MDKLEIPQVISVNHPTDEWPKYMLDTMAKVNELIDLIAPAIEEKNALELLQKKYIVELTPKD